MLHTLIKSINRYNTIIISDITDIAEMIESDLDAVISCLQLLNACNKVDRHTLKDFLSVYREPYGVYGEAIVLDNLVEDMVYNTDDFRRDLIHAYDL